jgi:cytochrome c551/c552
MIHADFIRHTRKMALKDLSVDDKVKIAIDSIIGDIVGKSSTDIAQKYPGLSAKAVTTLKNQALDAIRGAFSGNIQTQSSTGISDEQISAAIDKLLGTSSSPSRQVEVTEEETDPDEIIPIDQVVDAVMEYNNKAAKENGQLIYISKTVVQAVSPLPDKEIDQYFKANKEAIDDHNSKHGLKRNSNRALNGLDWQDWLEF